MPQCSEGRSNTNCNNHAQSLTECYNIKRSGSKEVNNINIYSCTAPRRQTSLRQPPLSALSHGRPSTSSTLSLPLEIPTSATTTTKWNWISKNESNNTNSKNNDSKTSSGNKDVNNKPFRVELCNDNEKKEHWLQSALAEELLHNERHAQKWEINKSANTHICANNERTSNNFFLPRAVKPTQNVHNNIYDRQEERELQRETERRANEHLRDKATAELKPVHNLIGLATYLLKQTSQHRNCPTSPTVFTNDHHHHHHNEEEVHQVNKQQRQLEEENEDYDQKAQQFNFVSSPVQENSNVEKDLFIHNSKNNNNNSNNTSDNNKSTRESKYTNTLQNIRDVYLTNTSRQSAKRRNSKSAANKLSSTKKNNNNSGDSGSGDANKNCHGMNAVGVLQYSDAYKHIYCTSNEEIWKGKETKQRNSPNINTCNDRNKNNCSNNNNECDSSHDSGSRRRVRRRSYNSSGSNNSNHTSVITDIANAYYNACQVSEGRSTPCTELSCVKSTQVSEPSMWEYCMQTNSNSSAKVNTDGQDRSLHGAQLLQQTASTEKSKEAKADALYEEHTEFEQQQFCPHQLNNEQHSEEEKVSECEQHDQQECGESKTQELYFDTSPLVTSLQTQLTPAHDGTQVNKIALKPSPPSSKPTYGAFRTYKQVEDMCVEQVKPYNKSLSSCQYTQTSNVNEDVNDRAIFSSQVSNEEPSIKENVKEEEVNADSGDIPCNRNAAEEVAITIDERDATVLSKTSVSVQVESSAFDTARDDNVITITQSEEGNAPKLPGSLKMSEKENTNVSNSFYQGLELALLQWQTEERDLIEQEYNATLNNEREFFDLAKCEIKARCDIVNAELEFTKEIIYKQWCAMISMQFCFVVDTARIALESEELHEWEYLTASEQAELLYLHHKADTSVLYLEQWKKLYEEEISQMRAIVKLEEEERNKLEMLDVKERLHQCEHVLYGQIERIATLKLENEHKENLMYTMLAKDEKLQRETIAEHEMDEYYLLLLNQYTLIEFEERAQFWQEQTVAFTFILSEFASVVSGQFNDTCRFLARHTDDANVTALVNTENREDNTYSSNNEQLTELEYHAKLIDAGNKGNDVVDDSLDYITYNREEGNITHTNVCNYMMNNQIGHEDERTTVNDEDEVMQITSSVRTVSDDAESQKANERELVEKDDSVSMHSFSQLTQDNTSKEEQQQEEEHDSHQTQSRKTTTVTNDTICVYEEVVAVPLSSCCCSYHMPMLEIEQKIHRMEREEEEVPQELQQEYEEEVEEETLQEEQELLQDDLIKYGWEDEMELQQDEEKKLNSYLEAQMQFWKEDNEQQARYKAAPPQFVLDHAQHSKFITAAAVSALHNFAKHKGKENNEEFADSDDDANGDNDDDDDVEDSNTIDSNDDKDDEQVEDVDDIADKIFDTNGDLELENETNIVDDDMYISDLHGEFYDNVIENINNKNGGRIYNKNYESNNNYDYYESKNNSRNKNEIQVKVNSSSDDSSSNNSSLSEEMKCNEYEKRCNKTDPEEQNFWKELQSRIEGDVDNLDAGLRDNRHDCHTHERCSNDSNNFWDEECDDEFCSESSSKEDDKSAHCKLRRVENAEELSRWNVQRRRREERRARAPLIDSTTSSKSNFSKNNSLTDLGISDT